MSQVNVISPSGEFGNIPDSSLADAVKYGYRPASSQEIQDQTKKETYGQGFGNELAAGVEEGLSNLTFGGSRVGETIASKILNAPSISPEAQAARKELNPNASMAGGLGALAGSLLLAPEVGLPALLERTSLKAAAKLTGTQIAEKTGKALIGDSIERTLIGNTAQKLVTKALQGMMVGTAYGAGQSISEAALGDPTITAQKVFHQLYSGAIFGAGIGAASNLLGIGAKKLFGAAPESIEPSVIKGTSELEGQGTITPQGPIKMQGTIDFGTSDKELLKQAERLNPKNSLKQNDLDWLKTNGIPDAKGKPTIFSKIGTPEIPTLDPMAQDQVYMGDVVKEGMKKLGIERQRLNQAADDALEQTIMPNGEALSLSKNQYKKMFSDVVKDIKQSKEYGLPIGKKAVDTLKKWTDAAKDMPGTIKATDLRDILQNIRDEGKIYVKGGGLKNDFVSKSLEKVQGTLDDYLKDNSKAYKAIQQEFAPFTRNSMELEDHLNWNWQRNDSDLISDWVTNRVAKPFQSTLPGTKHDADLMRWFSKYAGTDLEKASKTNFIFGKINPEAAQAGQLGTWGSRLADNLDLFKRPTEIPGKILHGAAKFALTGELPELLQNIKSKGTQDILLGKSAPGAVDSILSKLSKVGRSASALVDSSSPLGSLLVPTGVKLQQFVDEHDSIEDANNKLGTLMAIEKAKNKADQMINDNVNGIFDSNNTKPIMPYQKSLPVNPQKRADDIENLSKQANELVSNPALLMDRLSASMKGLGDHAPNIAANMNATAVRALSMVAEKVGQIQPQQKKPLDQKFVPSTDQLNSLAKTLYYINNPFDILHEIRTGMVSKEGKEVLQKVYPELYGDLKATVMNALSTEQSKSKKIPMSKQLGLSFFLGQPLNSTMQVQSIAANQATFATPMGSQNQPNPTASASKNLTLSTRLLTPTQKIASK